MHLLNPGKHEDAPQQVRQQRGKYERGRVTILGNCHDWRASQRGFLKCLMVSRSLIEFRVRVHRRDAEDTEAAQSPESRTLCPSAVKWHLQNYDSPSIGLFEIVE
jgi:hypothetical protein